MTRHYGWIVIAIGAGLLAMPAGVAVQSDEDGRVPPGKDWTLVGGDWTSARYSTLSQINTQTVERLGGTWMKKFDAGASTRATPVVKDGRMFIGAGTRLYALDAKTGQTVWTWQPDQEPPAKLEAAGIGDLLAAGVGIPSPPGVALGEGLVFVGLMDGHVAALRQQTGEVVWTQQIGWHPPKRGQAVSGAPIYARGIVFAGLANGDWALRGKVVALDAKTGRQLWEFFTVPGPGEFGHETWPQDDRRIWEQGGAGVWLVGAVDVELDTVYFVTGNAVPMFGGEIRKGDNLFTCSVLALDMLTGKLRWHYQVVRHDLWDADIAIPQVMYDAEVDGRRRKALAAMRADGYLFLLDRETGQPIFPVEDRPVTQDPYNHTAATQRFPVGAGSFLPGCERWKDKVRAPFELSCDGFTPPFLNRHNVVAPGVPVPGVRVTPMSYSPQTGYFYAQGRGSLGRARRISDDPWFVGSADGGVPPGYLPPGIGVVAAIDSRTNTVVWQKEVPLALLGGSGPLTTAGGLMFRGAGDGNFEAYHAKTGALLWRFQTGVGAARGPAATYEVDGEQYVALSMGPVLWAFKLGGTLPPQPAPPVASGGSGSAGRETRRIETTTLVQSAPRGDGPRSAIDEYAFNPVVARVKVGTTVAFVNNGQRPHTVEARDGAWSTGPLRSAQSGYVTFDTPGTSTYHCADHPWAIGQVIVEE